MYQLKRVANEIERDGQWSSKSSFAARALTHIVTGMLPKDIKRRSWMPKKSLSILTVATKPVVVVEEKYISAIPAGLLGTALHLEG